MIAGYVRLSRDDDGKKYVSIENQKLLIMESARRQGMKIDRWYEDDGVSGYTMERPGFMRLKADLEYDVDTIIAKDLSRIGRHNAKVLLFLDEIREWGKRLILVDDGYDTWKEEDDIIGIKTWYNERYVKDTSRKIRSVLGARQQEGTLICSVPFGYERDITDKTKVIVVPEEAEVIRQIFHWYENGLGFRRIAGKLQQNHVMTPSAFLYGRTNRKGKPPAEFWNDKMVGSILKNDYYAGVLRQHKRVRTKINGTDHRVAKENQIIFENHHEAIISKKQFAAIQEILREREKKKTTGITSRSQALFAGFLYCKDCGGRLTPIHRKNSTDTCYICSTYNTKGKKYCSCSHRVKESRLKDLVMQLLEKWGEVHGAQQEYDRKTEELLDEYNRLKEKRKLLIENHLKELLEAGSEGEGQLIKEVYWKLKKEINEKIYIVEQKIDRMKPTKNTLSKIYYKVNQGKSIEREYLEEILERIEVNAEGKLYISFVCQIDEEEIFQWMQEHNISVGQVACRR